MESFKSESKDNVSNFSDAQLRFEGRLHDIYLDVSDLDISDLG